MTTKKLILLSLIACYIFFVSLIIPDELLIYAVAILYAGIWKFVGFEETFGIWSLKFIKAAPRIYAILSSDFDFAAIAKHAYDLSVLFGKIVNPNYIPKTFTPPPYINVFWLVPFGILYDWMIIAVVKRAFDKYSKWDMRL